MRRRPSLLEQKLSSVLDKINIVHFPQTIIVNLYVFDEYLLEQGMIVEANKEYWHNLPERSDRDKERKKELVDAGYRGLDIWEHEFDNPDSIKRKILDVIAP
jgi:very-short-patch-repair endonuclease